MTQLPPASRCKRHDWERRLEIHHGVQCVVRYCLDCGAKELCWSRRPVSLEPVNEKEESYSYFPTASG
jgi:hypothetical protein